MDIHPLLWTSFAAFIIGMLALDLGVFHRKTHTVSVREALGWTAVWVGLALAFNAALVLVPGWFYGPAHVAEAIAAGALPAGSGMAQLGQLRGIEFLTGFLIEYCLSVDNIFVFVMIFTAFKVPAAYQHKVLFWGVFGAVVMRVIFIFAGVELIQRFHWLTYVFGALLVFIGVRMAIKGDGPPPDPVRHPLVRLVRWMMPLSPDFVGDRFMTRIDGRRAATPLLLVLVLIESTDLLFAVDSIPAVLAITQDEFVIVTSNVFAIMGLRSLYFALAGMMDLFHYLKYALAAILSFVGVKMMLASWLPIPALLSLGVIAVILAVAVVASLRHRAQVRRDTLL